MNNDTKTEQTESEMVMEIRNFFKGYKGCINCVHRGDPYVMCEHGRNRAGKLICPGWKKEGEPE